MTYNTIGVVSSEGDESFYLDLKLVNTYKSDN